MKEFAYGTAQQYEMLDRELSEGKKYKYADRILPDSCTPGSACLWFAKENHLYRMYIDKGIVTSKGSEEFRQLLERGEASFSDMDSMIRFLHSLQPLFSAPDDDNDSEPDMGSEGTTLTTDESGDASSQISRDNRENDIVDRDKLSAVMSADEDAKNVIVWPEDIATRLKSKVFGQDAVIDALADLVVTNHVRKGNKLLVVTFLGPTATGKSETAKSLAKVMSDVYGREYGCIEIAGSEFIGQHVVNRFFGAPPGYVGHGEPTLLDPVRKNPYHVIVINEIEKADGQTLIGLMEAIDTGFLGMADNSKPIDLNRCIMLFTSNIPIDKEKYEAATGFERSEMCRDAFTRHCGRPEISGKIGNFLVFSPLSDDALTDIVIKFVREELDCYGLTLGHIDEYLMADYLKQKTKYGARGIRGLVNETVGRHLIGYIRNAPQRGKKISLSGTIDSIVFDEMQEGA